METHVFFASHASTVAAGPIAAWVGWAHPCHDAPCHLTEKAGIPASVHLTRGVPLTQLRRPHQGADASPPRTCSRTAVAYWSPPTVTNNPRTRTGVGITVPCRRAADRECRRAPGECKLVTLCPFHREPKHPCLHAFPTFPASVSFRVPSPPFQKPWRCVNGKRTPPPCPCPCAYPEETRPRGGTRVPRSRGTARSGRAERPRAPERRDWAIEIGAREIFIEGCAGLYKPP